MRDMMLSNAAVLHEKGCHIAVCTDHPEVPVQYLRMSAALAVKGGLPREAALRALTSEAADMLGVADRIGRIEVGLDADLVLFPEDPLDVMQDPAWVMIGGRMV